MTFLNRRSTVLILSLTVMVCCLMAFMFYVYNKKWSEVGRELQDFSNHPTYEKMKHLQKSYEDLDYFLKERLKYEFSLLPFRLRVAENKLALSQWHYYYTEYMPLDEGYFRAYIKQYRRLIDFQNQVNQLIRPQNPTDMYSEMLSHIEDGLAFIETVKPIIEIIQAEHNLSTKEIDDMPLYPLSGWLNGHNREMPLEVKLLTLE